MFDVSASTMDVTGPHVSRILLLLGCFSAAVAGRSVPHTPCGKIFNYFESETHEIFGSMKFKNDFTGIYHLIVNMSIPIETTENIRLSQRTPTWKIQNGEDIEFYVHFPFNHTFPVLTAITFNQRLYCIGQPAQGENVTPLSQTILVNAPVVDSLSGPPPGPPPTPAPAPAPAPPQPSVTNIMIQININRYPSECGINIDFQPLVIAGNSTRDGEYPWLVALFVYTNNKYNFKCAGNLITDRHVLTAAHCVKDLAGKLTEKDDMLVVMGSHSIKNWARRGTTRGVTRCAVHRDYTKPSDADIALLTMEEPVQFSLTIKPICMWEESDAVDLVVGTTGVVAGWGRDEEENTYLTEPRQVFMPIVSQEECLRSDERFFKITSPRSFCAGERKGSTPCTGDSGGGFIIKRNRKWTLRGIVSVGLLRQGTDVCDGQQFTVFSDVSKYKQWIVDQMDKR